MPGYTIEEIKNRFPSLASMSIGILGVSYRTGVKEAAFSGALTLLKLLKDEGAIVFGYDPFFTPSELKDLGFECAEDYSNLNGIIIHTAHDEFHDLNPDMIAGLKFIYDGRNVLNKFTKAENSFLYFCL
jgi:UDP-N-acetyl-D-mannosaminuronate dehydrogenase